MKTKNADIEKLLKEGKDDLKTAALLINVILFFFTFSILNAQIPLNGFGALNKINSYKNKQKIVSLDYNQDSIPDLITFGSKNERITLHPGSKNGFENSIDKFFFYLISDLKLFNNFEGLGQHYIFISRKEKLAGLISFTNNGTINLLNKIQFNSYPSAICTGDINNDGNLEAVVAGKNFNGISILKQNRFKLSEEQLIANRIFSSVNLTDLDFDGFPELIAFDELENSLVIFANDEGNGFSDERKIKLNDKIINQHIVDFNNDGFIDIIYSNGNAVKAVYGDSVSSFDDIKTIIDYAENTNFVFMDINSDKKDDFIFLDENNNQLYTAVCLKDNNYSNPILLFKGNLITDLCKLNYNNSICILDSEGFIYQIYKPGIQKNLNIAASCSPNLFGLINFNKNLYLYYFDENRGAFVLLLLNSNLGIAEYYQQNITTGINKIKVVKLNENKLSFICYNHAGKHFDEILFNPQDKSLSTKKIFTKKRVIDADYFSSSINNGLPNRFAALTLYEGELRVESYNTNTQSLYTEYIDSNVVAGLIITGNTDTTFYWTQKDSTIKFIRSFLQPPSSFISDTIFETDTSKVNVSNLNSEWMNDIRKVQIHAFPNSNENSFILINNNLIILSDLFSSNRIETDNLKLSYNTAKSRYSLWQYQNNGLSQYLLDLKNKKVKLIYYIDYLNCKDYFVSDFTNKRQILIYTNSSENYFSLQTIE